MRVRIYVVQCVASSNGDTWMNNIGASEHHRQRSLEITREKKLCGSHSRLTNVLELGDNRGIQSNNT